MVRGSLFSDKNTVMGRKPMGIPEKSSVEDGLNSELPSTKVSMSDGILNSNSDSTASRHGKEDGPTC